MVPAHMFRKVISLTKSHCKLGLTGMFMMKLVLMICGNRPSSFLIRSTNVILNHSYTCERG